MNIINKLYSPTLILCILRTINNTNEMKLWVFVAQQVSNKQIITHAEIIITINGEKVRIYLLDILV